MAMAATRMAVEDAKLPESALKSDRCGIILGTAFGGVDTFEKQVLALDKGKKVSHAAHPPLCERGSRQDDAISRPSASGAEAVLG